MIMLTCRPKLEQRFQSTALRVKEGGHVLVDSFCLCATGFQFKPVTIACSRTRSMHLAKRRPFNQKKTPASNVSRIGLVGVVGWLRGGLCLVIHGTEQPSSTRTVHTVRTCPATCRLLHVVNNQAVHPAHPKPLQRVRILLHHCVVAGVRGRVIKSTETG